MSDLRHKFELEKNVRRFREKFHGNIAVDKANILMRRYANNHNMVTQDVMRNRDLDDDDDDDDDDVDDEEDDDIKDLGARLRLLPLTEKNMRMFDNAQNNLLPSVLHQFACQLCDQDWWRSVPQRKRVSRCHRCKRKYDPVPHDQMWGIGQFSCPGCGRAFRGWGRMDLGSPCYTCRTLVIPSEILPPREGVIGTGLAGPRRNQHSCFAEDCFNRQEPHVPGTECVHPRSRQRSNKPRVVNPSPDHESSGSTVNTCLSQGGLVNLYDLIMDDIREESEEQGYHGAHADSSASDSS